MNRLRQDLIYFWKTNPDQTLKAGLSKLGISSHTDDEDLIIGLGNMHIDDTDEDIDDDTIEDGADDVDDEDYDEAD